jgi:hypothetical protein
MNAPVAMTLLLEDGSICVINPSKFGLGIGIDEARSVGKRILASGLPSHSEQNAPAGSIG